MRFCRSKVLAPNYYWEDETPVFNEEELVRIAVEDRVDTVISHTAPSFCELQNKSGLEQWPCKDPQLMEDVRKVRDIMDKILLKLKSMDQPVSHWYYGHFHQSWLSSIDGVLFKMLDIMELTELK